jgi:molybdopterin converting factor subunit 1
MIRVLYFAWLRERIGHAEAAFALPENVADIAGLITHLVGQTPGHAAAFANPRLVRAAVNQEIATPATRIEAGDEIAFFPPVTGG